MGVTGFAHFHNRGVERWQPARSEHRRSGRIFSVQLRRAHRSVRTTRPFVQWRDSGEAPALGAASVLVHIFPRMASA